MADITKIERDICIDKYCLREFIKPNSARFTNFANELVEALQKQLGLKELDTQYLFNIINEVVDGDKEVINFVKKQKPMPSFEELRIITASIAYLIIEEKNKVGGQVK